MKTRTSRPHAPQHTSDLIRLHAFSDGVFAIAITLLGFEIRFPEVTAEQVAEHFPARLWSLMPKFLGYVVLGGFFLLPRLYRTPAGEQQQGSHASILILYSAHRIGSE